MSDIRLGTIDFASPDETSVLAKRIAPALGPGDTLLLEGPIGAGKSHFARSVIESRLAVLGRVENIPSPTYTLVQTYDLGDVEIWHADLYRLSDPSELMELGLEEAFSDGICLVEWPDRLGTETPDPSVTLSFSYGSTEEARQLEITRGGSRWRELLDSGTSSDVSCAG
ncbi:MAG: tRNA (adenosine(37)-N6)-threonylcarbamoyltransferase complex ATPase subunit type 1 TsaE [Pseudomonadota bacterium]